MPLPEAKYHYSFGNPLLPGLAKLMEECGELVQILAKKMAYPLEPHPDGQDTDARIVEEMGDVLAGITFYGSLNLTKEQQDAVEARRDKKVELFRSWHAGKEA
jgi:NTP pyrophosphatase (non-canonical NTP hydrolase)